MNDSNGSAQSVSGGGAPTAEPPAGAAPPVFSAPAGARPSVAFANTAPDATDASAERLAAFLSGHGPVFVLTGAGCSTGSGIPDYRDHDGRWKRSEPIRYQRFVSDPAARRRYWARSFVGWPRVARAFDRLAEARAMLVVGSSLTVFSGFRFCRRAAEQGLPMAILNRGRTRADDLAGLKLDSECGGTLEAALRRLSAWG